MTGLQWAILGAALAVIGGGIGSAAGISYAARMAAGILSEAPERFGGLLVLVALPGTQGVYGFITAILVLVFFNLLTPGTKISQAQGLQVFLACLPVVINCLISALYQGLVSTAATGLVAKREEATGRAIVLPALVETYALFSLIATIFLLLVAKG